MEIEIRPLSCFRFEIRGNQDFSIIEQEIAKTCDFAEKCVNNRANFIVDIPLTPDINLSCQLLNGQAYFAVRDVVNNNLRGWTNGKELISPRFANTMILMRKNISVNARRLERGEKIYQDPHAIALWQKLNRNRGLYLER